MAGYACYFGMNQTDKVVDSRGEREDTRTIGPGWLHSDAGNPNAPTKACNVNIQPGVRSRAGEGDASVVLEK